MKNYLAIFIGPEDKHNSRQCGNDTENPFRYSVAFDDGGYVTDSGNSRFLPLILRFSQRIENE